MQQKYTIKSISKNELLAINNVCKEIHSFFSSEKELETRIMLENIKSIQKKVLLKIIGEAKRRYNLQLTFNECYAIQKGFSLLPNNDDTILFSQTHIEINRFLLN